MSNARFEPPDDRSRIGWWLFVIVLALAAAYIAYSFVGLIVLGVFGYYATRPIYQRVEAATDSDGIAAFVTILLVLLPIILITFYTGFLVVQAAQQFFGTAISATVIADYFGAPSGQQGQALASILQDPSSFVRDPRNTLRTVLRTGVQVLSVIVGALLLLALAVTLSYFLLKNDDSLAAGLRELFGGRDTTAYAYASAVDEDLESVFFGNFLFVVVMMAIAALTYWATNALAPAGLRLPMVFVLAFLTGVSSLIPIVVGKLVYLPAVGYLGLQAVRSNEASLTFVGGVLVAYFLVLDVLPQTFLQPYITGRQLDVVVLMFAYLLGPVLFGWYGFFFLPIVFVLMLEAVRIVLPELVHGEPLTPDVSMGDDVGTDPQADRSDTPDPDEGAADDTESNDDTPQRDH